MQDLLRSAPKGQLLTPEQGCGFSTVPHKRIVGGAPAKPGAWPWIALIVYNQRQRTIFGCGNIVEFSFMKIFKEKSNLE